MKNKKGFTIVEIVIVIAILLVIAGLFSVNMIRYLDKNKEEETKNVVTTIKSAADAYVSSNPEAVDKLYNGYGYVDLTVGELREAGFLGSDLADPETGNVISDDDKVRAKIDNTDVAENVVTFVYPLTDEEKTATLYTLSAPTLYIDYDESGSESNWCKDDNDAIWDDLKAIDNSSDPGKEYTGSIDDFNVEISSCNVNPKSSGTYQIKYNYTDSGIEKTYTRTVYVKASTSDVLSFTAEINHGNIIYTNQDVNTIPITIIEKSNSSNVENTINTTVGNLVGYDVDNLTTDTAGTREATIFFTKSNTDGSKPSPVKASYKVTGSLIEIAKNKGGCTTVDSRDTSYCYYRGTQSNNYVSYNNTIYRIYYIDKENIKLIYDGKNITAPYGLISYCRPTSCCNNGRLLYNSLNGTQIFDLDGNYGSMDFKTMDGVLNDFYKEKIEAYGKKYMTSITSADSKSRNISLLGRQEYILIGNCSTNGSSCKSNYVSSEIGSSYKMWLFDSYESERSKASPIVKNYVVSSNSAIGTYGLPAEDHEYYFINDNGSTRVLSYNNYAVSKSQVVKPVIQLKNPIITSGEGTKSSPWIIE